MIVNEKLLMISSWGQIVHSNARFSFRNANFFFLVKQTDFTAYKPKTDIKNASE